MDYDKILGAVKAAGATYAVMVTKHHDGFTLWPSDFGDIGTKQSFGGRDFVKEFTDACRKHGLKVGLYYSPPDWWFDRQYKNFSMGKQVLDMDHKPVKLPARPKDHDAKRAELVRGQVTELLTNYGKVDLIWFDGGKGEIPNTEVRRLQPGVVINKRNGGNGDYGDSEVGLPGKRFSGWFETCATCWPSKKWAYTEEYGFDDAPMTLTKLVLLRAWGGNLLANLGPMGDGSAPQEAYACWSDMAKWMEHSRESVIGAKAGPWPGPVNLPVTTRGGAVYIHFLPDLPEIYPNTPPDEKKFTKTRSVMPSLPPFTKTAVWANAPKPAKVTLLRTGQEIPHTFDNGTLTITLPDNLRTGSVDVVKVLLAAPAS
jgi:alpha-L-fucosidase